MITNYCQATMQEMRDTVLIPAGPFNIFMGSEVNIPPFDFTALHATALSSRHKDVRVSVILNFPLIAFETLYTR